MCTLEKNKGDYVCCEEHPYETQHDGNFATNLFFLQRAPRKPKNFPFAAPVMVIHLLGLHVWFIPIYVSSPTPFIIFEVTLGKIDFI